jgi:hypothetical protein
MSHMYVVPPTPKPTRKAEARPMYWGGNPFFVQKKKDFLAKITSMEPSKIFDRVFIDPQ